MRSRKTIVLLLALAALAALLLLLWPEHNSEEAPESAAASVSRLPTPTRAGAPKEAEPASPQEAPLTTVPAVVSQNAAAGQGLFLGRVLNAGSNAPVPGAELVFSNQGAAESVTTDADGAFRFEPSKLGTYQLAMASAEGYFAYAPEWESSPIELIARHELQVEGIVVYLTPRIDYHGEVVDAEGQPVAGASIVISATRESALAAEEPGIASRMRSDEQGNFVFNARDFSRVRAEHEGKVGMARVDGAVQISRKLRIVLGGSDPAPRQGHSMDQPTAEEGTASLRGRVRSVDGEAVASFNVMLARSSGIGAQRVTERAVFDGAGEFHFDGLAEGEYIVNVAASGYAMGSARGQASENSTREVEVQLARGATLFGHVLDLESKEPLELAKVSLESQFGGGPSARPMVVSAVTDAEGAFELSGLRAGRRSVFVAAAYHHSRIVSALDIVDGERIGPITVELTPVAEGETPQLELAGIGAKLAMDERGMLVDGVIEGGGAAEAGIEARDVIVAINGRSVVELGWEDSIQSIRGPIGTQVTLLLQRGEEQMELLVTRRAIRT